LTDEKKQKKGQAAFCGREGGELPGQLKGGGVRVKCNSVPGIKHTPPKEGGGETSGFN